MANDIRFGIRITADGQVAVTGIKQVAGAVDEVKRSASEASGALSTFKGALGALQIDRMIQSTVRAVSDAITQTISYAAALDDLADVTGSSVEDLSGLANQAKISGVGFQSLEGILTNYTRRLSAADDESKKMGAALRMLGVESRDPVTAMRELALKLDQYADGANKATLVHDIFGRGMATQVLPLLKDLARETEAGTRVTREQAEEAEKLQKAWNRLGVEMQGILNAAILPMVSGFNTVIERMRIIAAESGGVGEALRTMWAIGSKGIEGVPAAIAETTKEIDELKKKILGMERAGGQDYWVFMLNRDLAEAERRLRTLLALRGTDPALRAQEDRGFIPERPNAPPPPGGRPRKSGKSEEERAWEEHLRELDKQYARAQRQIQGTEKEQRALNRAFDEAVKLYDKNDEGLRKIEAAARDYLASQVQSIAAYERETEAIGATRQELELLERKLADLQVERNIAAGMSPAQAEALRERQLAAIRARYEREFEVERIESAKRAAQEAADEWVRQAERLEDTITDGLMRAFESGSNFGKSFLDTLKNMAKTLVLRPIIQATVAPLAGGLASMMMPGGASASMLGGGGLGGIGDLFSLGSGISDLMGFGSMGGLVGGLGGSAAAGMFSMFGGAGASQAAILASQTAGFGMAGTGATLSALGAGGAGAAMGALGAIGSAIPYVGMALAIASMLGAFDRGGPKVGASASSIPGFGRYFTPDQQDSTAQSVVQAQGREFAQILRSLGGTGTAGFAFGWDQDPEGDAGSRVSAGASVNGRMVYNQKDIDVGRDEGAVEARLQLESKRALLAALQASELPAQIASLFNGIAAESASAEQIQSVIDFGAAMGSILTSLDADIAGDAAKAWERSQAGVVNNLRDMGQELATLAREQDGSLQSMQALGVATANYRQALTETLVAIQSINQQIVQSIASTREQIEFAGLSPQQAFDLAWERGNALMSQIALSDDPAEVQRFADQIQGYFTQAWGLLDPSQIATEKPRFLEGLDNLENFVNERLSALGAQVQVDSVDPMQQVRDSLDLAAPKFLDAAGIVQQAAATQASAAQVFSDAVDRFIANPIRAYVDSPLVQA